MSAGVILGTLLTSFANAQTEVPRDQVYSQQYSCPASGCKVRCAASQSQPAFEFAATNKLFLTVVGSGVGIYTADNGVIGKETWSVNLQDRICVVAWD